MQAAEAISEEQKPELLKAYLEFLRITSKLEEQELSQITHACNASTFNAAKLEAQNVFYKAFLIAEIKDTPDTDDVFLKKISKALTAMDDDKIETIFTNENLTAIMNVPSMLNLIKESKKSGKPLNEDPSFVDNFLKALLILFVGSLFLSSAITIISMASTSAFSLLSVKAIFHGALAYATFGWLKARLISESENIKEVLPSIKSIERVEQQYTEFLSQAASVKSLSMK